MRTSLVPGSSSASGASSQGTVALVASCGSRPAATRSRIDGTSTPVHLACRFRHPSSGRHPATARVAINDLGDTLARREPVGSIDDLRDALMPRWIGNCNGVYRRSSVTRVAGRHRQGHTIASRSCCRCGSGTSCQARRRVPSSTSARIGHLLGRGAGNRRLGSGQCPPA
jgi:hypothetical protein